MEAAEESRMIRKGTRDRAPMAQIWRSAEKILAIQIWT